MPPPQIHSRRWPRQPPAGGCSERRRGPSIAGAIPGVAITGDALVDLLDGREPLRYELTWPGAVAPLARELRARLRGEVVRRAWGDVVELCARELALVDVRVRPSGAAAASHARVKVRPGLRPIAGGAWSDPVLTARAARLTLDGRLDDAGGDLAARRVRLIDPDGFRRRPEALLHLARLGSRPGWTIEPQTLAAARAARAAGTLATAPVVHLGAAFEPLIAAPEAVEALLLLQRLAPDVPLADGVEVDEARLRAAVTATRAERAVAAVEPSAERAAAVLQALAPDASRQRIAAFLGGTRLVEPYRYVSFENDSA